MLQKKKKIFSCISNKRLSHLWKWQNNCIAWTLNLFQVVGCLN